MAVPTHSNNKSASVESMGVPVLFTIKNVQPLILAAKPKASSISTEPSVSAQTASSVNPELDKVGTNSTTTVSPAPAPKARRTGMLSKVVATGFVVMLVVLVVRFSVPSPKVSQKAPSADKPSDIAGSGNSMNQMVTGPEAARPEDNTRIASLPTSTDFSLGLPELKKPEAVSPAVPVLPPLLSVSNAKDSIPQATVPPAPISLNPPVAPQEQPAASITSEMPKEQESPSLELSSSQFMTSQAPASAQAVKTPRDDLHVVETLTPDRSLAEFESLFRNASKSPMIPYRPVSSGGHTDVASRPGVSGMQPSLGAPATNSTSMGTASSPTPTGYQPITIPPGNAIPPYEKGVSPQPLNRYTIRQPQRQSSADTPPSPTPYQPLSLPDSVPSGSGSTNYGYPPVQYSPTPNGPGPVDPPKANAGQQQ